MRNFPFRCRPKDWEQRRPYRFLRVARSCGKSQPSVELRHWRILLRGNGDLHLTAQLDSGALRVTSKLQFMELASGAIRTESGRSYQLCAPPEGDKVLRGLMRLRALRDLQMISGDVSDVIWAAIAAGAWPEGKKAMLPAA